MSAVNKLSQPLTLKNGVTLSNRIVKSALSEVLADEYGTPTIGHLNLYRRWAQGGAALLITGNIMVDRRFLSEPNNVVLDELSDLRSFKQWVKAGTVNQTQLWAQLNHPGKQTPYYLTWQPVAPSAMALSGELKAGFNKPRALAHEEILVIIQKFATSAKLAQQVGFTGVQIHAAHGYLVNQFLSPLHNKRQDEWGGTLQNRMRFVLEVYRAIRAVVGKEFPVAIKLNSADFQCGGFSEEESMQVVKNLAVEGIDLIEISGGTYESQSMSGLNVKLSTGQREAYFLSYAEKVRTLVNIPLMVTGGFRSSSAMQQALQDNATDLIGLGRPFAVDPEIARKLKNNLKHSIEIKQLSTGIKPLDKLTLINITWYEHQLARIATNKDPIPKLSPWVTIFKTVQSAGIYNLRRRRV